MRKKQPPAEPAVSPNAAPIPIRECQFWVMMTESELFALVDGVIPDSVKAKAGMVDRPSLVQGQQPYGVVFVPGEPT